MSGRTILVEQMMIRKNNEKHNISSGAVKHRRTGLYIHIPFCVRKCNYCAFLSLPGDEKLKFDYAEALCGELKLRADILQRGYTQAYVSLSDTGKPVIDTVYFGGGTPSIMDIPVMSRLMTEIRQNYDISPDAEITLEANPGTLGREDGVTGERLKAYRCMGINRLSMGVQSMNNDRLHFLGRVHTAEDVARDVKLARAAGFDNISLDIIFSVPGETEEDAIRDAEQAIALRPEHISCYSMQLEEGTLFFSMAERGEIAENSDEEDRRTYHSICSLLRESGYEHYEISNFARMTADRSVDATDGLLPAPGFGDTVIPNGRSPLRASHNSLYWNMTDYIGWEAFYFIVHFGRLSGITDVLEEEIRSIKGYPAPFSTKQKIMLTVYRISPVLFDVICSFMRRRAVYSK